MHPRKADVTKDLCGLEPIILVQLGRAHDHYTNMNTGSVIVSQKALTSTLLKVVALVLWMLKRSNLHNNCIEMGIK